MRDRYVAQHTVKIKAPPPHRGSLPLPHTPFIAPHQIDFFWATRELAVPPLAGRSLAMLSTRGPSTTRVRGRFNLDVSIVIRWICEQLTMMS